MPKIWFTTKKVKNLFGIEEEIRNTEQVDN